MGWLLAPALVVLRDQINARYPNRSKASDGTIGDAAHAATGSDSDHNPWVVIDGQPYVTAMDVTHDPVNGIDIDKFSDELQVLCRDGGERRVKYVIANGLLMDTRPQFQPYQWTQSSGHDHHVHISVMDNRLLLDTSPWRIPSLGAWKPGPPPPPPVRHVAPPWPLAGLPGHFFGLITGPARSHGGAPVSQGGIPNEGEYVLQIQQALQHKGYAPNVPGWADRKYEQPTADAVARFQHREMPGTEFYGQVWADDWAKLLG